MIEERLWPAVADGAGKNRLLERRCLDSWIIGDYENRDLEIHVSRIDCPGAPGGRIQDLVMNASLISQRQLFNTSNLRSSFYSGQSEEYCCT